MDKFAKGGIFQGKPEIHLEPGEMIIPHKQAISILGLDDIVRVVRCKDCKHCTEAFDGSPCCGRLRTAFPYVREDDFCSYGERKDNDI